MFLRNHWYVAAWDHELGDRPLSRTLLDEPVVLFRGADGKVVGEKAIMAGSILGAAVDFLIISLVVFFIATRLLKIEVKK